MVLLWDWGWEGVGMETWTQLCTCFAESKVRKTTQKILEEKLCLLS